MTTPLVRKLLHGAALTEQECSMIEDALDEVREFEAGSDIMVQGAQPGAMHVVLRGFACRYKLVPDGGRQISAYLLPGDTCDLNGFVLGATDHSIGALTRCQVAYLPHVILESLMCEPGIARALWWSTLVDEATLREWLLNIGRRNSERRVAHLFCELYLRLRTVGLTSSNGFDFPLTQAELADTVGITPIHTNRVLQQLRASGLITLRAGRLQILDMERLAELAGFEPAYLHRLEQERLPVSEPVSSRRSGSSHRGSSHLGAAHPG